MLQTHNETPVPPTKDQALVSSGSSNNTSVTPFQTSQALAVQQTSNIVTLNNPNQQLSSKNSNLTFVTCAQPLMSLQSSSRPLVTSPKQPRASGKSGKQQATLMHTTSAPLPVLRTTATIPVASSLFPSNQPSALPLGSLTFQSPSGGIQVAVPVTKVLTLPSSLQATKNTEKVASQVLPGVLEIPKHVLGSTEVWPPDVPHVDTVGCYESVETFTGLDTSVDETKAD